MATPATRPPRSRTAPADADEERPAAESGLPTAGRRGYRLDPAEVSARRMRQRRRRTAVVLVLLVAATLVGVDLARGGPLPASLTAPAPTSAASATDPSGSASPTAPATQVPSTGSGTFWYAGQGRLLGSAGTLRKYRVAVENGSGVDAAAFGTAIEAVLGDPRGWTASRQLRLQRVPKSADAEFTIYLATPGTSEKRCAAGGLHTDGFASCRLAGQVIINLARWLTSVPDYGAPLSDYQAYAVNHEVGRQLGRGNEACTGAGNLAPVMQQQTYGLKGCLANSWPYVDGKLYTGPPVP